MANNVFGNPITDSTLEYMPEYIGKVIRRIDRAHVALNMKNAQDKDLNARKFVEQLKEKYGNGVSTLCLIYNATGDTVKYATDHNWHGHIGDSPYPEEIANGQWGAFLHVHPSGGPTGSSGAVVYRGKNNAGDDCDWMLSWSVPWNRLYNNHVYTEIREAGHFDDTVWGIISDKMDDSGLVVRDEWNECLSSVSAGGGTSPVYEGILTLKNADNPPPSDI